MRVRVMIRVRHWLLVAVTTMFLISGLFALLALDSATNRAVAGEIGFPPDQASPSGASK